MISIPDTILNADGNHLRILYLAPYAPDLPDLLVKPYNGDGGYPTYHYNIFILLQKLGFDVYSSSKPYALQFCKGNVDYVFSLLNRMPIINSEIYISAYCEFLRIPYLGAMPNIRAIAEDKFLSKLVFSSLNIPTPQGIVLGDNEKLPTIPFDKPYFIKDRFGAASEGITEANLIQDVRDIETFIKNTPFPPKGILIEEFCAGIDVTVPVLGGKRPVVLGFIHQKSNKHQNILTGDLKLFDHLGYEPIELNEIEHEIIQDINKIWDALGPIDYFRLDYRIDFQTGQRRLIEMNICCHLGKSGAICIAAKQHGLSQEDITKYIINYSLDRQRTCRQHSQWII